MRDRKLVVLGVLCAVAVSLIAAGCKGGQEASKPGLPVIIEAYYPMNESHKFIADYLKSVESANPGKVTVSVYDMQSQDGRKKWTATGLSCAGVFVNGSTHHEIKRNGKVEGVDFLQRMDVFWTHDDFETVMKQLFEDAGETFVSPNYQPKPAAPAGAPPAPEAKPGTPSGASPK